MSEEQKDIPLKIVEWIYAGQRVGNKGKRLYAWTRKGSDSMMHYDKPLVSASVGNVYLFTEQGDSFFSSGEHSPKYFGKYEDKDKVAQWAIADEAARQELSRKAMNTKVSKEKPLDEALDDLRRMARTLNTTERLTLISKCAEIILKA